MVEFIEPHAVVFENAKILERPRFRDNSKMVADGENFV